jgi:hypothetical protein
MKTIKIDRFASATCTARLRIPNPAPVAHRPYPEIGDVIVAEVLDTSPACPSIEIASGEVVPIKSSDIIAGVVGSRHALQGFVGYAPYQVREDDELSLLNAGGVIGRLLDTPATLEPPVRLGLIGAAMNGDKPFNIAEGAVKPRWKLAESAPIILVVGTSKSVGKTEAASRLIKALHESGRRICGAKLSGVAALGDLVRFSKAGACKVMSFLDAGFPSTVDGSDLSPAFKGILATLNLESPDMIVVELGDGLLGRYRVDEIVSDRDLMSRVAATIVCATDLAGAFGARETLNRLGLIPTLFAGPVTDTIAGTEYIEEKFGIPAINALKNPDAMTGALLERLPSPPGPLKGSKP